MITFFLAFQGYEQELASELSSKEITVKSRWGRFFLSTDDALTYKPIPFWAQWTGTKGHMVKMESLKKSATFLKNFSLKWTHWGIDSFRRGELLASMLPQAKITRFHFSKDQVTAWPDRKQQPLGLFTLLSPQDLLYFPECQSYAPQGQYEFHENKIQPPSRAYLKLWEFFTRYPNFIPSPDDHCLDIGASPGGWSWVLSQFTSHVFSLDKAPLLTKHFSSPPFFIQQDALKFSPSNASYSFPKMQRVFSDMVCYPDKWIRLIKKYLELYPEASFVCTLKFQGETPFSFMNHIQHEIGGSFIHLYHNKNEATWFRASHQIKKEEVFGESKE
jgi:23S rRNA (cytidine2498-2'-O)-methyltransferase